MHTTQHDVRTLYILAKRNSLCPSLLKVVVHLTVWHTLAHCNTGDPRHLPPPHTRFQRMGTPRRIGLSTSLLQGGAVAMWTTVLMGRGNQVPSDFTASCHTVTLACAAFLIASKVRKSFSRIWNWSLKYSNRACVCAKRRNQIPLSFCQIFTRLR